MTIFWKAPVAQGGLGHGSYGWVVHNGGEGWGRDLEKNFKYKKNSNTKDAQEIHTHHAIKQEYTNKPGRNWSLLKWLLNLLPTWRTSETCLENTNTNTQIHRYGFKTEIQTWPTRHGGHAHCSLGNSSLSRIHRDGHPKVGRESRHACKYIFKDIGWHPPSIFSIIIIHLDFFITIIHLELLL